MKAIKLTFIIVVLTCISLQFSIASNFRPNIPGIGTLGFGCFHNDDALEYAIVLEGQSCPAVPASLHKDLDPNDHNCQVTMSPLSL